MAKVAEKVVVLDHHKTAQADLEGLEQENPEKFNIIFDMARSGAGLAWQFFHPFSDLPDLLAHIQDRDLWQFKLEGTKEIHAALGMYPREFSVWEGLLGKVDSLKKEGAVLLRKQEMEVEAACRHAKDLDILGYNAIAINSTVHQSEIGNKLCKQHPDHPFAAIYTIHDHEDVRFGLRSIGDFDVSAIAQKFGGGGHKNAAGFQVSLGKFLAGL
jgi:nanoRNase/pAp phosphatase (c-di-AMP/oligoRNAs hydrolase)